MPNVLARPFNFGSRPELPQGQSVVQAPLIPITPSDTIPIFQVNEGDYDFNRPQTTLEELGELVDYATGAPARSAVMEVAKRRDDGAISQMYGALKELVSSFGRHPSKAPTGKQIAEEVGVSPMSFKEAAGKAGQDPSQYPDVSPADVAGLGIDGFSDISNYLPLGIFGGASAKGFKRAGRKFSGLWDKKPRFEINDMDMKINRRAGTNFMKGEDADKYWSMTDKDRKSFDRYAGMSEMDIKPFQEKRYDALKSKYGLPEYDHDLDNVIDHPELFKNYPELKDIQVKFDYSMGRNTASYNDMRQRIKVDGYLKDDPEELKKTLLHEIQHYVQHEEGFAQGGNPGQFAKDLFASKSIAEADIHQLNLEMGEKVKAMDSLEKYRFKPGVGGKIKEKLASLKKEYEGLMERKLSLVDKAQVDIRGESFDRYQKLAGEAEARDVSARMNFTDAERQATQPLESTGLRLEDLIVEGTEADTWPGGGANMSMDQQADDLVRVIGARGR